MSTHSMTYPAAAHSLSRNAGQADLWETLVAVMPVLALTWIVVASLWSARVVGIL